MRTIGLIGGMSWESTATYYRLINEQVNSLLGGLHSAKILLHSVDFAEIEECQSSNRWDRSAAILADAASGLEAAGADFIVICTNTMHKVAPQIAARISIPILHIADATAGCLREAGIARVGLLGTKYTMSQNFYREKLQAAGIDALVPGPEDMETVNAIIYDELCRGRIVDESRKKYQDIIARLAEAGAAGIILGCTEIGMLVSPRDSLLPVFDTTDIHARAAARMALAQR